MRAKAFDKLQHKYLFGMLRKLIYLGGNIQIVKQIKCKLVTAEIQLYKRSGNYDGRRKWKQKELRISNKLYKMFISHNRESWFSEFDTHMPYYKARRKKRYLRNNLVYMLGTTTGESVSKQCWTVLFSAFVQESEFYIGPSPLCNVPSSGSSRIALFRVNPNLQHLSAALI